MNDMNEKKDTVTWICPECKHEVEEKSFTNLVNVTCKHCYKGIMERKHPVEVQTSQSTNICLSIDRNASRQANILNDRVEKQRDIARKMGLYKR